VRPAAIDQRGRGAIEGGKRHASVGRQGGGGRDRAVSVGLGIEFRRYSGFSNTAIPSLGEFRLKSTGCLIELPELPPVGGHFSAIKAPLALCPKRDDRSIRSLGGGTTLAERD
jgi:hypothetical protein